MNGADESSELFNRDFRRLVRFIMTLGAEQSAAEDAAQTAYALALQSWDQIERPEAWVRTVGYRVFCQERRNVMSVRDSLAGAGVTEAADLADRVADHVAECDLVLVVLGALPPRQREVMAWRMDGYTPDQIARELRTTPENVRKALQRARERLKITLAAEPDRSTR